MKNVSISVVIPLKRPRRHVGTSLPLLIVDIDHVLQILKYRSFEILIASADKPLTFCAQKVRGKDRDNAISKTIERFRQAIPALAEVNIDRVLEEARGKHVIIMNPREEISVDTFRVLAPLIKKSNAPIIAVVSHYDSFVDSFLRIVTRVLVYLLRFGRPLDIPVGIKLISLTEKVRHEFTSIRASALYLRAQLRGHAVECVTIPTHNFGSYLGAYVKILGSLILLRIQAGKIRK